MKKFLLFVTQYFLLLLTLTACGGGGTSSDSNGKSSLTPSQISALTSEQIKTISGAQITALGTNIKYLSDSALNELSYKTYGTFGNDPIGQIQSITAAQIDALSPAQVRMIGAAGPGGSVATSQIQFLNAGAWAALASNPSQVAAITPAEVERLSGSQIIALGTNIKELSDAALNVLSFRTYGTFGNDPVGQIQSLTVAQIRALSPAQVRMIGAAGPGGSVATSQIQFLNAGTWAALASNPTQVAAITPAEVEKLSGSQIIAFGTNIKELSDAALNALSFRTYVNNGNDPVGQIQSLTVVQIGALTPSQISTIAGISTDAGPNTAIAMLNAGAFSALRSAQVAVLTPTNVRLVSAAQLASLTTSAIAGFTPTTVASFTAAQKAALNNAQRTACNC